MVYRIYVEKKESVEVESKDLYKYFKEDLKLDKIDEIRILNRYDAEGMDKELFDKCVKTVFSEPQVDMVYEEIESQINDGDFVFAISSLPGQFDQRADSAAQCIQIVSQQERPLIKYAKVYIFEGKLDKKERELIKSQLINEVESEEVPLELPEKLSIEHRSPSDVMIIDGFTEFSDEELVKLIGDFGLAMDLNDIRTVREYFAKEMRNPSITEIRVLDTYWSDHCRHTTFNTILENIEFEDETIKKTFDHYIKVREEIGRKKPVTLMDLATIVAKDLIRKGKLNNLDASEEINACTVKIKARVDGKDEDYLLLFKNETHNHPTEIEPFGGAATCIGGAIRDPLSGRAYVYNAMRITGAANPLKPISETMEGKLPQRTIVTKAAQGYSSYGNQIGVSTGLVDEIYHDGFVAKHMELGAVVGATPKEDVIRKRPAEGDVVILLGGKTGRDGCGGATGSSKSHDSSSLTSAGAEVQKGNAPEERKIQRLFRNSEASKMIKRCNDFGAGGVSVAIGELASGLDIDLDKVPKKYEGLDGTELAISESQERMAVVISKTNAERFIELANSENIEATVVAMVTADERLVMRWRGKKIVDISREFLDTDGAPKYASARIKKATYNDDKKYIDKDINKDINFKNSYIKLSEDLNICSKRGLSERFDSTIGAGAVLMPWGGKYQLTPEQVMACKISTEKADSDTCSIMAYGFNPFISEESPYHGAYLAVLDSVTKLVASGVYNENIYLSFQEFFGKLGDNPDKWGLPISALLGAFRAQEELGFAAIGGKDSMSGSYEDIDVPPSLISFAITSADVNDVISSEFKAKEHDVYIISPKYGEDKLPIASSIKNCFELIKNIQGKGLIESMYAAGFGGIAEAVMKMSFGNKIGFRYDEALKLEDLFSWNYGSIILETNEDISNLEFIKDISKNVIFKKLGKTLNEKIISYDKEEISIEDLISHSEEKLEPIYSTKIDKAYDKISKITYELKERHEYNKALSDASKPQVLIPVFPGTNCEYDSAKAITRAGGIPKIMIIRNLTADDIERSIEEFAKQIELSQMIFIPGGFSGGDEPDGSGKFITSFFRNDLIREKTMELLNARDGLMCGICNGFQALIKLGLVPFGEIRDMDEECPTLTLNEIGRHQSKLVRIRIASNKSPWLAMTDVDDVYTIPISHGEGRLIASDKLLLELAKNGQIATQYVDLDGNPSMDIKYNPNGSVLAIEGLTSPDGRVFGKMGHSERISRGVYKNVKGNYDMKMFESAVKYFK